MHPFYKDFIERLIALHQGVLNSLEGLPSEALDWTPLAAPSAEINSINVLVVHLCGAERYWVGDVSLGEISDRVRAAEFEISGMSVDDLNAKINAATEYAKSALQKLTLDDLTSERTSPRDGRVFTVSWALLHALEHTALHLGHIQITRQIWDEQNN
jgi:uncharacterized damage-inducible protein DinB